MRWMPPFTGHRMMLNGAMAAPEGGAFGRERDDADVVGDIELAGHVPTSLVHQHNRVSTRRDGKGYFGQMQ